MIQGTIARLTLACGVLASAFAANLAHADACPAHYVDGRRGRANCKQGGRSTAPELANSLEGIGHRRHLGPVSYTHLTLPTKA